MGIDGSGLGTDLDSGEPVVLPDQTGDLGVTVLGQTGYGKTTLLGQLILRDIARGTAVIVVDAHGDLTQRVLSLAETDEANLLLLEAWEDAPFRLNLFDCPDPTSAIAVDRTVSGVVQVFKRLFGSPREFYPRLERDLGNAARTVIANQGTLLDVPRLFWDPEFRSTALARVSNPHVREFWRLWERMGREDRRLEQLEATINRLDQFLASEFVAQLVGSTASTVPFDELLDGSGRVLLVHLPVGEIGEGLTNLLGALFLAVLTERIFARARLAPQNRPRVHLYLDEYGRYATPTTAQLLTEGRKFGVGTTIAHQTRAQIPDAENRAAELQVGTLVCLQLIGADAQELSGEFHVAPEPQWEEPVEEIDGTEPVLGISQNPVDHLLTAGHSNPAVKTAATTLLGPLTQAIEQAKAHPSASLVAKLQDASLGQPERGRFLINRYLVDCMEHGSDSPTRFDERVEIFLVLRGYVGIESAALKGRDAPAGKDTERYLRELLSVSDRVDFVDRLTPAPLKLVQSETMQVIHLNHPSQQQQMDYMDNYMSRHSLRHYHNWYNLRSGPIEGKGVSVPIPRPIPARDATLPSGESVATMHSYFIKRHREHTAFATVQILGPEGILPLRKKPPESLTPQYAEYLRNWKPRDYKPNWTREEKNALVRELIDAYERLFAYDEALVRLGELLAAEPILVPTGQERPRVRLRYITHPQRSYQDVQNELAVQLANLPRFTAYVSIHGNQHKIRLSPPLEAEIDEARIERIRAASKARFGRPPRAAPPVATTPTPTPPSARRLARHPSEE